MSFLNSKNSVLSALGGAYFLYCISNPAFGHYVDYVDLVIHEAGHFFFMFFGQFWAIFGGSLLQIIIPIIFCLYFFIRGEYFPSSFLLMWVGYNLVNVSIYMEDAILMELPLLGGEFVIHDWNYLLSYMDMLSYSHILAWFTNSLGVTVFAAALFLSFKFSKSIRPEIRADI